MTKKASAKNYEAICDELGVNPSVKFVKITNRGTISFTAGKPSEIRALYRAAREHGYEISTALKKAAEQ